MKHGFFIKRLRVAGETDNAVQIEFNEDLTIVFGASDIGKTFIYQCIYYMLGSREEPKRIKESKKYTRCVLEIKSYKGDSYKLKRYLDGGNFTLFRNGEAKPEILYIHNNKRKEETISKFLLSLTNIGEKEIKTNQYTQPQELFFQDLRQYFLVNEDDIIVKKSNIIGSYNQDNLFKFLVTGEDDKNSEIFISPTVINEQKKELKRLNKNLKNLENEIETFGKGALFDIESSAKLVKHDIESNQSKITLLNEKLKLISNRKQNYVDKIFCPQCNKELICNCSLNTPTVKNNLNIKKEKEAINEEINLLKSKVIDLEREYLSYIKEVKREELLQEQKKDLIKKITNLEVKIEENEKKSQKKKEKNITMPIIKPIEKNMFEILKSIKFKITSIKFSKEKSDFIINGQDRELYGQGYRAIIYTSFIVAILKHLRSMPYQIGFMMIDSPLNAYRAKDEKSENLSDNFYHYFKEESSNGSQIIIFENTDVPDEVKDKIKKIDKNGFLAVETLL
jgi:transcription elongation factor Elf1